MRILYQSDGFLPGVIGGVEVLSWHLLKALRQRGHDIRVVTGRTSREPGSAACFDGLDLLRIDFNRALQSRALAAIAEAKGKVAEAADDFKPDILHLNDVMPSSFFFRRHGALARHPRLLTLHSPFEVMERGGLAERMIADADRVVAVSQAQADGMSFAKSIAHKLSVIRNALPIPQTAIAPPPAGPPRLLFYGRLVPEKGLDVAIRACRRLRDRGHSFTLTIAGSGDARPALEQLGHDLLADHVTFQDWVEPALVPSLINTSTLVLMPSRWREPFGLAALQAAQMGRPVVASSVGGLQEIVVHGQTGLLVPPDDDVALADAIASLLAEPSAALRMGMQARRRAETEFSFGRFVDAYEAAYLDLMSRWKSHGVSSPETNP